MSAESLEYADKIILDAYRNGSSIKDMKNNVIVKHRLRIFGEWINGAYYLNERGFDYAMNGCRKGIKEQIETKKRIDSLTIKIQSFSENKQNASFILSIVATIGSIVGILTGFLGLLL